ncbi:MAG: hypothetical protein ACKPCG_12460, partial [Dolichospermum sp.]
THADFCQVIFYKIIFLSWQKFGHLSVSSGKNVANYLAKAIYLYKNNKFILITDLPPMANLPHQWILRRKGKYPDTGLVM